ncbi:hypothetical protein C8J57DRAFT_1675268 [Mycena rebaudengoi]|nr:hypothetical protein C8J57DRAFT_1675268 [Mycena rebaudengoi]
MPLRVRRLILDLSHLVYFLGLKDNSYARAALNSSIELAANGKKSWAKDLITAVTRMPFELPELILTKSTTIEEIEEYSQVIKNSNLNWLQDSETQGGSDLPAHLLAVEILRYVDHALPKVPRADRLWNVGYQGLPDKCDVTTLSGSPLLENAFAASPHLSSWDARGCIQRWFFKPPMTQKKLVSRTKPLQTLAKPARLEAAATRPRASTALFGK